MRALTLRSSPPQHAANATLDAGREPRVPAVSTPPGKTGGQRRSDDFAQVPLHRRSERRVPPGGGLRSPHSIVAGAGGGVDASEREADRTADLVLAGGRPGGRPEAPPPAAGSGFRAGGATEPGRPLSTAERNWFEPRFGRELRGLRVHEDGAAADCAAAMGARAFAHGRDLYFGKGEYDSGTDRGRWLMAHEIAHALEPRAEGRIAAKALTDLPAASRKKLRISRVAPPETEIKGWITNYFNPRSGVSVRSALATEFGSEITDTNQQKGLRSIAIELANLSRAAVTPATATEPEKRTNTDPANWPLPADAVLDLALDLRTQGGEHAIFRFTRYTDGAADTVLIEKTRVLAPAPVAGGTPATLPAAPAGGGPARSFTGDVQVGSVKVGIDAGFGDANGKILADAVGLLPDPIRAKVDGVTFSYAGSGRGPGGQNGEYNAEKDTVRIWGDLFKGSPRRVGEATNNAYQVVHELGHVIDLRPEYKAQRDREKARERKKALEGELRKADTKFIDPNDPLGGLGDPGKDPRVVAEKKRIQGELDKVVKEIADLDKAVASAKSIAGSELGADLESLTSGFAKALAADGVKAVPDAKKRNRAVDAANEAARKTNAANPGGPQTPDKPRESTLTGGVSIYAATDLMEAFAENFTYYALDEALFKAIRPATHAFFAKAFPKTVAPKPSP